MKWIPKICLTALLSGICLNQGYATTWSTDFSSLTAEITFTDGADVTSSTGSLPLYAKVTNTDEIVKTVTSAYTLSTAIQLTDYSTITGASGGLYMSSTDFAALGSSGYLSGSFSFVPLSVSAPSGTRGQLVFAISSSNSIGSSVSAIQIAINSDYSFGYFTGGAFVTAKNSGASTIYLSAGTKYTLAWWENYTSSTQDTYGFSIYDGLGTTIFSSTTLNTRASNITPAYMLLLGGTDASSSSSEPFIEIESVSIANVIPEPNIYSLLFMGAIIWGATRLLHLRKTKHCEPKPCA